MIVFVVVKWLNVLLGIIIVRVGFCPFSKSLISF